MSGTDSFPPPGATPPPPGAAPFPSAPPAPGGWAAPPPLPGGYAAAPLGPHGRGVPGPPLLGAAHKPGAIPLRPLNLGDLYDGAFKVIRFNPRSTVGAAVVVAAVAMAVPVLLTAALTWTVGISLDPESTSAGDAELVAALSSFGSLGLGIVLQSIGLLLVSGMVAHVVAAAAVGRRLDIGEAWRATRGKRWRLVGLSLLIGLLLLVAVTLYVVMWVVAVAVVDAVLPLVLLGIVTGPLAFALMFWLWIRVTYLPVPALMLEDVGILGAIRRGYHLTAGQFWRTFGIALLTVLLAQTAGGMLGLPIAFGGQALLLTVGPEYQLLGLVVVQALSSVITAAFVTPFTTAVIALQYVDQRMRKEAFDVELLNRAGITTS